MESTYELSIVVPAYNEAKSLPSLIERYSKAKANIPFQLVIVDNGSRDETADYLKKETKKKQNGFIKIVTVKKNIGYGYGIHQGLKACDGRLIGWSHADLQCSPEDVFKGYNLFRKINKRKTLIKGNRKGRDWKPLVLTYGLSTYASLILLHIFDDINGQPKIFPRELLQTMKRPPLGFSYDLYIQYKALQKGYKVRSFTVVFEQRMHGISKWAHSIYSKLSTIRSFFADVLRMRIGKIR
ncbi:glycosyl transferase family 2 [Candidatus Woesearchaeota archaeon]|nr:glycosyl transferase family 2 [Candidatus Woesearchaeota archaeon]